MRNTDRVAMQHLYAITPRGIARSKAMSVPLVDKNIDLDIVAELGTITLGDYELEDDDWTHNNRTKKKLQRFFVLAFPLSIPFFLFFFSR